MSRRAILEPFEVWLLKLEQLQSEIFQTLAEMGETAQELHDTMYPIIEDEKEETA